MKISQHSKIFYTIFTSLFLLIQLSVLTNGVHAQPSIQWQNTIGGSSNDQLWSVDQTADGGSIIGGRSNSNISGVKTENGLGQADYWVLKLDASGAIMWQNTIGGSSGEWLTSVRSTLDGGYILGGTSSSNISGDKTENSLGLNDYWVVKLDSTGLIQWENTIGGSDEDILLSVDQTNDGGYILGGTSSSNISGDKTENSMGLYDYWVVKLDSTGLIQWENTIGGNAVDELNTVVQTSDNGYLLGGLSESDISGDKTENSMGQSDYWVVKLDSTGLIQWENTIGGGSIEGINDAQETTDGGYILGGWSYSDASGDKTENRVGVGSDYWIVKLDNAGGISWQNTIGGTDTEMLSSIQQTSDGGYLVGGFSTSSISGDKTDSSRGGEDYWVLKLDSLGAIMWQKTLGGSSNDRLQSVVQLSDDGYLIGGFSDSPISGDKQDSSWGSIDYWVVKLCGQADTTFLNQSICLGDSALIFGNYYSTSGEYFENQLNVIGCDSIIQVTLTVTYSITDPAIAICSGDSVFIYGEYRYSQGVVYDSSLASNGCDSIHSTILTVNSAYSVTEADISICDGQSTVIYGVSQNTAGTYYDTLSTVAGCDSILSKTLMVNPTPNADIGPVTLLVCDGEALSFDVDTSGGAIASYTIGNFSTTVNDMELAFVYNSSLPTVAVQSNVTGTNGCTSSDYVLLEDNSISDMSQGVVTNNDPAMTFIIAYMPPNVDFWYWSFGDGDTLSGDANPQHTYSTNGNYEVYLIGMNSCETDSDLVTVTISGAVGVNEFASLPEISIYPNPTTGILNFEMNSTQNIQQISIVFYDVTGRIVLWENEENVLVHFNKQIDISSFARGVYTVKIVSDEEVSNLKLILE